MFKWKFEVADWKHTVIQQLIWLLKKMYLVELEENQLTKLIFSYNHIKIAATNVCVNYMKVTQLSDTCTYLLNWYEITIHIYILLNAPFISYLWLYICIRYHFVSFMSLVFGIIDCIFVLGIIFVSFMSLVFDINHILW